MVEVVVMYRVNILEVIDVLFLFGMIIWMVMATMIILMAVIMVIKVMVVMVETMEMEFNGGGMVVEYVEAMVDQKDKDKENRMNIGQPKFVERSSNKTNNNTSNTSNTNNTNNTSSNINTNNINNSKRLMSLHLRTISVLNYLH